MLFSAPICCAGVTIEAACATPGTPLASTRDTGRIHLGGGFRPATQVAAPRQAPSATLVRPILAAPALAAPALAADIRDSGRIRLGGGFRPARQG